MSTMAWLLRREYWENRGSFLKLPLAVAAGLAAITLLALAGALAWGAWYYPGSSLSSALSLALAESPRVAASRLSGILQGAGFLFAIIQAFVLFFYLLGSLYTDRSDRSALFWSSLPVSAAQTVSSKALTGIFIIPLIALAATIAFQSFFVALVLVVVAFHGISPWPLALALVDSGSHVLAAVLALPLHVLLSLPAVGWLLLVSAWSRRRPFLWAIMVPLMACLALVVFSWTGFPVVHWGGEMLGRLALGLFSNPWTLAGPGPVSLSGEASSPGFWIAAAFGCASLAGAMALRSRSLATDD